MSDEKKTTPGTLTQVNQALQTGDLAAVRELLADLHPADIANLIAAALPEDRLAILAGVAPGELGETLLELPESIRGDIVERMDQAQLVAAAHTLDTDDIADLIPDLSDDVIAQILRALNQQDRQRLDAVLSYPEDTAGGLMNVDTVTVREGITVEVVLRYLRVRGELPADTNKLFVVNRNDRLIGTLYLAKLLTSDPKMRVGQLMDRDPITFNAMTRDRDVAAAFERYNLITAPVVDDNNRLLGRITVDDAVDVIRELADRSVMAPAGLVEGEDIFAPVARASRRRAVWLGVNLLTAFLASWVIGRFESTIQQLVALAVLMPIVASMGGNTGTQTMVLVVRGLALGTVTQGNATRVLLRQMMIVAINAMVWALVVAAVTVAWYGDLRLAAVIGAAIVINFIAAGFSGVMIPFLFHRLKIDPALASGVMLTTVTDVVGFLSFLGLAALFLV